MALSAADRAALRDRAAGLRVEVSSLNYERTAAITEASATVDDQLLLDEVARLERERDAAVADRDSARGTVADAMAVMEAVAQQLDVPVEPPVNVNPEPLIESAPVVIETTTEPDAGTQPVVVTEDTNTGEGA